MRGLALIPCPRVTLQQPGLEHHAVRLITGSRHGRKAWGRIRVHRHAAIFGVGNQQAAILEIMVRVLSDSRNWIVEWDRPVLISGKASMLPTVPEH